MLEIERFPHVEINFPYYFYLKCICFVSFYSQYHDATKINNCKYSQMCIFEKCLCNYFDFKCCMKNNCSQSNVFPYKKGLL